MYIINPHHRNSNTNKSQWTISVGDEIGCFNHAKHQNWLTANKGWGLHIVNSAPNWLGVAQDQTTQLFVAKFVGNPSNSAASGTEWHGYPANYRVNNQDIPDEDILQKWLNTNILPAAKIRKLAKGQPCNL
jgi:hypothetical protein